MKEIWKDIPEYEEWYQASNIGRVKSLKRKVWNSYNESFTLFPSKILKPKTRNNGYLSVHLTKNGVGGHFDIHQLVAMAFLGHKRNGHKTHIHHKDSDKQNNHVDNLEIITPRNHAIETAKKRNRTSEITGVSLDGTRWKSQIRAYGKTKHLGYFDNEIEAGEYYENALHSIINGLPIKVKIPNFSSKYKGVFWSKNAKKWGVSMTRNKKNIHLGYFESETRASIAFQFGLLQIDKLKKIYNV